MRVEPIPASCVNSPLEIPNLIACLTVTPIAPPTIALVENAPAKIDTNDEGICLKLTPITIKADTVKNIAIIGTIFSATAAILVTPPPKTKSAINPKTIPVTYVGILNAFSIANPMEFDCIIFPTKPRAIIIATEKKTSDKLANFL